MKKIPSDGEQRFIERIAWLPKKMLVVTQESKELKWVWLVRYNVLQEFKSRWCDAETWYDE